MTLLENPYEPPAAEPPVIGLRQNRRENLRKVAVYQKGIVACILVYLVVLAAQFAIPESMTIGLIGVALCDVMCGTVIVFLLSTKVYKTSVGVWMSLLTMIPCLGLGMLAITDRRATALLRQNGIRVGPFGANLRDI